MDRKQISERISKAAVEATDGVGPERRAFLNAALVDHLASEFSGDLAAIVRTFSEDGHSVFNGVRVDTERLEAFHRAFGWDGHGFLSDIDGDVVRLLYTHQSVIAEFILRGTVNVAVRDAPAGRAMETPICTIYQFDESGKLKSERAYIDTGAFLPEPILSLGSGG